MKKNKICIGLVTIMSAGSIMSGCQNGGPKSSDTKGTAKDTAKATEKPQILQQRKKEKRQPLHSKSGI